jgi:addiction module RelB/DinJ family antitoxin
MINNVNHLITVLVMAANALVTTRIDPAVKDDASAVLAALGLTLSDAVRLLLTKVAREGALPFDLWVPSPEAIATAKQARRAKPTQPRNPAQKAPESVGITTIPETSPNRYLSGMAALNIPSASGSGDWHLIETFFRPRQRQSRLFIAGIGCPGDTTPLLGNQGVFDCTAQLDELKISHPPGPVYAANHARAIADLVLVSVLEGGSPNFVQLDDWMPDDDDKQAVFDLLRSATPLLNSEHQKKVLAWQTAHSH